MRRRPRLKRHSRSHGQGSLGNRKQGRRWLLQNQSVQKVFALLRSFSGPQEWVTNAELSRRTGLSEACAHRLMKTLEDIGAVVRDRRGCYRPGMVLATLSKDVAIGDLIRATSEDALAALATRLKGVVHVGVLHPT